VMGYCVALKRMVEMAEVETIQLPDLSFVHRGKFTDDKGKVHVIHRKVYPQEIIIDHTGHHFPNEVHVGQKTPEKIFQEPVGQLIIVDGKNIKTVHADGKLKTREELEAEVKRDEKVTKVSGNSDINKPGLTKPGR